MSDGISPCAGKTALSGASSVRTALCSQRPLPLRLIRIARTFRRASSPQKVTRSLRLFGEPAPSRRLRGATNLLREHPCTRFSGKARRGATNLLREHPCTRFSGKGRCGATNLLREHPCTRFEGKGRRGATNLLRKDPCTRFEGKGTRKSHSSVILRLCRRISHARCRCSRHHSSHLSHLSNTTPRGHSKVRSAVRRSALSRIVKYL